MGVMSYFYMNWKEIFFIIICIIIEPVSEIAVKGKLQDFSTLVLYLDSFFPPKLLLRTINDWNPVFS